MMRALWAATASRATAAAGRSLPTTRVAVRQICSIGHCFKVESSASLDKILVRNTGSCIRNHQVGTYLASRGMCSASSDARKTDGDGSIVEEGDGGEGGGVDMNSSGGDSRGPLTGEGIRMDDGDGSSVEKGDGGEGAGVDMKGSGGDSRDPLTGEGIWMDDEDEPLVLEKPKRVQKFCGKVISANMDKTIKVAVPYWYYVKGFGRKTIRHSKIMAHDEENSCGVGDRVILVDCKRKSKRKAHTLYDIVHKLPTLDD